MWAMDYYFSFPCYYTSLLLSLFPLDDFAMISYFRASRTERYDHDWRGRINCAQSVAAAKTSIMPDTLNYENLGIALIIAPYILGSRLSPR